MYRKNTASQFVCFQMLLTATGAVATGLSPAVRRCIDGTFAGGGGTVTEDGTTGSYKYAMSQADTNGNDISFIFSAATAMPVCINIVTTAVDPTAANLGFSHVSANTDQLAGQTVTAAAGVTFGTTVAATGDAMALTSGERNSTADAFLNRDMSTGTDSGSPSVRTVRQALRFLRNKWTIAAGTLTVLKEDDSTTSWTATVSTDASAIPIVGNDPA